ncbi:epoxide hydrolase 2 isoform X3 [Elaeis guineensis]|uniref:Bifunctional epoxide hydrolase 2 isoform X3 n=1 Tax=Elaeis guineensis var. tenera TaxID=51953 RepID=A0A8N4ETQ3_ELAGV|nr:bifunctional epoxide hydrolase 2 isoform X3 [Elaeis guineensis]
MEGASGISHRTVEVNGIRMHVAEKGEGPPVLLLHGFPELWYTWRHQIAGLAARGYRAIAPDLRGYGDTDAPPDVASYTVFHLVGDLVALLDTLALSQVFVVGHDWGAFVAWHLCMLRPDRVKALVNLSVPFMSRNPAAKPLDRVRASYGDEYYIIRFQDFARTLEKSNYRSVENYGVKSVVQYEERHTCSSGHRWIKFQGNC